MGSPYDFPQGRAVPPLSGADRALYDKAVEAYRSEKNNPALFDTAGAIPCELDERVKYLLAYQMSDTSFEILSRRSDRIASVKTRNEPLQVSVLAGKCADGKIEGPFDVVTKFVSTAQTLYGEQNMVISQRVRGTMSNGEINGPLSIIRHSENEISGARHVFWWTIEGVFRDNEQVGSTVTYSELPQINSTVVSTRLSNGFIQARGYGGSVLGSVITTFQGQFYGPLQTYADGKPQMTTFYWAGRPVTGPEYLRTPLTKPLETVVGVGLIIPQDSFGAFEIADVFYPSPASDAGLLPGDIVTAIDGQSLNAGQTSAQMQQMFRGEEGSDVTVQFKREGEAEPRLAVVTRGAYKIPRPGR